VGEPYILHPLEVALICARDIGLKTTSIIAALLHDVVEDTDYTLDDIKHMFGPKIAQIIDGLTKISGINGKANTSEQAESIRKILLTLSEDVRVILIKLADRLHNMRTLDSMPLEKQLKISSETEYIYAPLAHRLGLNSIKIELEDLILKYKHPEAYELIGSHIKDTKQDRKKFIQKFIAPLRRKLNEQFDNFTIVSREKSRSSIWSKMQNKGVDFKDIYDLFAIRIVIDSTPDNEKADCWQAYSVVTETYHPKQDRLRDWISMPKANGYESLHTTVMSRDGRWVEVQIRTVRMDEIAEKGYAAHFKYKGRGASDTGLDEWLTKIRELIQKPNSNTLDFLDEFKLNLFTHEIYAFTPKGEIKTLPRGATVLDFAYAIHSEVGNQSIGAKVNNQLTSVNAELKSGDQVEILTSARQKPTDDWPNWALTARAKSQIKIALNDEKKKHVETGKKILANYFLKLRKEYSPDNIAGLQKYLDIHNKLDFYYQIANQKISQQDIEYYFDSIGDRGNNWVSRLNFFNRKNRKEDNLSEIIRAKMQEHPESFILEKDLDDIAYSSAPCCSPIPGDDVIGFIKDSKTIMIHRTTCPVATRLASTYGKKIVKTKWREKGSVEFLIGIRMEGIDDVGIVAQITNIISSNLAINIRSLNIEASDGLFFGEAMLYVNDTAHVDKVIRELRKITNIKKVGRIKQN
jgi:guanosine-3',5'-bis(diphosphate) 3'-pyrophosphohydrolase